MGVIQLQYDDQGQTPQNCRINCISVLQESGDSTQHITSVKPVNDRDRLDTDTLSRHRSVSTWRQAYPFLTPKCQYLDAYPFPKPKCQYLDAYPFPTPKCRYRDAAPLIPNHELRQSLVDRSPDTYT